MAEFQKRRFDVLKIDPASGPVYLLVPAVGYEGEDAAQATEYLYEERRCPKDTLHSVEWIIAEGDSDPHGVIEYVRTTDEIDFPVLKIGETYTPDDLLRPAVPEAF